MSSQTVFPDPERTPSDADDYPEGGDTPEGPRRSSRPKKPVHHPNMVDPRRMTTEQFCNMKPLREIQKDQTLDTEPQPKNNDEIHNKELSTPILVEKRRKAEEYIDTIHGILETRESKKRVKAEKYTEIRSIAEQCANQKEDKRKEARSFYDKAVGDATKTMHNQINRAEIEVQADEDRQKNEVTRKKDKELDDLSRAETRKCQEFGKIAFDLGRNLEAVHTNVEMRDDKA